MDSGNSPNSYPRRTRFFVARFSSLDDLRDFVGQAAEECGMPDDMVYKVQMATDEAFSNIVEHGYAGGAGEQVECACQLTPSSLIIQLRDRGKPFSPQVMTDPDVTVALDEREAGGLGLFFMRKLMDEVRFELLPATVDGSIRNQVTMVKYKEL